jgi:hypothetical protein
MLLLPWSHLEHAELLLGFVVFYLEASGEVGLEAKFGTLAGLDLLFHVVAVYMESYRLVGADLERYAVAFVDGDLVRAHLATFDGDIESAFLRRAGRVVGTQQEEQSAQDEHDNQDYDRCSRQLRQPPFRRVFVFVTITGRL